MDELFSLLRLQAVHESGEWEAIVVDCAPTGETLRLLSFPDVARWWIEKVFPVERQLLAAAARWPGRCWTSRCPPRRYSPTSGACQNLIAMNEILRDRSTSACVWS